MSWSQTDKHTHTALHTRSPPPRLGRRETRGWSSPKDERAALVAFPHVDAGSGVEDEAISMVEGVAGTRHLNHVGLPPHLLHLEQLGGVRARLDMVEAGIESSLEVGDAWEESAKLFALVHQHRELQSVAGIN